MQSLCQTGGGLKNEAGNEDGQMDMTFRISGTGPDASTLADALNLWGESELCFFLTFRKLTFIFPEQIEKAFPFFPRLHYIFATCPNVNPICTTTALGPQGRSTTWYQPPVQHITDDMIDPELLRQHTPTPTTAHDTIGDAPAVDIPAGDCDLAPKMLTTPARHRPLKSSSFSHDVLQRARASISSIPKKRTVVDTLIDLQRYAALLVNFSLSQSFFAVKTYMLNDRNPARNSSLTSRKSSSQNLSIRYGHRELIDVDS